MTYTARTLITILAVLSIPGSATLHGGSVVAMGETVVEPPSADPVATVPVVAPVATITAAAEPLAIPLPADERRQTAGIVAFAATAEQQDRLDWAAGRFAVAGLDLPHIEVHFFEQREPCDGYEATFRQHESPLRIDVCNANRLIILHELAHAWEWANLDDGTREAFVSLRGLESWNSPNAAWKQRGVEDMAEVVVWGLIEWEGPGGDEAAEKLSAFELVTGTLPPRDGVSPPSAVSTAPSADDYS